MFDLFKVFGGSNPVASHHGDNKQVSVFRESLRYLEDVASGIKIHLSAWYGNNLDRADGRRSLVRNGGSGHGSHSGHEAAAVPNEGIP